MSDLEIKNSGNSNGKNTSNDNSINKNNTIQDKCVNNSNTNSIQNNISRTDVKQDKNDLRTKNNNFME